MDDHRTTALIIAADRGEGFAAAKYTAPYGGVPLLRRVLDDVATWPVHDVVVVLGDRAEDVLAEVELGEVTVVIDPEWGEGMLASVRVGLDVLARDGEVSRCVLALGDEVGVPGQVVASLLDEQAATGALVVVPKYRYQRSWPIVVAEEYWWRLMGLEGDHDVVDLLASHPEGVHEVHFDELPPRRVRTAGDLPSRRGG